MITEAYTRIQITSRKCSKNSHTYSSLTILDSSCLFLFALQFCHIISCYLLHYHFHTPSVQHLISKSLLHNFAAASLQFYLCKYMHLACSMGMCVCVCANLCAIPMVSFSDNVISLLSYRERATSSVKKCKNINILNKMKWHAKYTHTHSRLQQRARSLNRIHILICFTYTAYL